MPSLWTRVDLSPEREFLEQLAGPVLRDRMTLAYLPMIWMNGGEDSLSRAEAPMEVGTFLHCERTVPV
jgi:hypothetical protein